MEEDKQEINEEERIKDITIEDLETISKLGQGAYGQVNLVKCTFN